MLISVRRGGSGSDGKNPQEKNRPEGYLEQYFQIYPGYLFYGDHRFVIVGNPAGIGVFGTFFRVSVDGGIELGDRACRGIFNLVNIFFSPVV